MTERLKEHEAKLKAEKEAEIRGPRKSRLGTSGEPQHRAEARRSDRRAQRGWHPAPRTGKLSECPERGVKNRRAT